MRGVDEFVLRGAFEELVLRVLTLPVEPTAEQRALGERALTLLRFELRLGRREAHEIAVGLSRTLGVTGLPIFVPESSLREEVLLTALLWQLELELGRGRLLVESRVTSQLTDRRDAFQPELPPLPPPRRESSDFSFELRVVDEIGRGVSGVDADFSADEPRTVATNAAGVALLEGVRSSTASVARLDPSALSKALAPRWSKPRPGAPPKEGNSRDVLFRGGSVGGLALKAAVSNRVVLKPPRGKLHLELFDKRGRVRHGKRPFTITGPESFSGTTDEQGRLLLEVFPGDYELSLTLEFFQGDPDAVSETVTTSLVVQEQADSAPQRRLLGAVPRSVLARLHFFFNTNKAFLLPTALPAIKKLGDVYVDNSPSKLLVVGHADTAGGAAYNDRLSLDRARATIAYLKDDVDTWLKFYDLNDDKQRWGKVEDRLMITSMPDFVTKPKGEDAVRFFQRTRGLEVDGVAGPKTRTQLITEYMALDGTSLRDFVAEIEAVAHGCGENFPLADDGEELDAAPVDEKRDPGDRRVELFFFDTEFGVTPEPPSENSKPGSPQYPKWRERVLEVVELRPEDAAALKVHFVEVADAHFRTNSAVVLPEGENPDATGEHQALTSVGVMATALKFNDENAGRSLLVAGHTDTSAEVEFNQKLSNERAQVALALLKGGPSSRDSFRTLCNGRHTVADIKQILSWVSRAIPGFACDPGAINDTPAPASVRAFQLAYNENKGLLNPSPQVAPLDPDGAVGELTWGAFFDCYEFALKAELGVDDAALAALRQGLNFADPKRESLGFSEHFPIEELGVDGFRSQTNRRVEILFFESGEEPDLEHAANDPETSDLYLPGRYQHVPLGRGGSTPFFARVVEHETGRPLVGLKFELLTDTAVVPLVSDQQGILQAPGISSENGVTLATVAPAALAETSFVVTVVVEGEPTDLVPDPLVVTDAETVVALTPHQVATGETLATIAAQRGSTSDAIVTFHMGEAGANAEQSYLHFVAGARHVDAAGTIVFQDDDQPGILHIPGPLALSLELGKRHVLRLSRVVVPFIVPKPPVYMRVLLASVDTFDSADMTVTAQGLVQGDLVRILEEISTEDNCKIRFVRVPPEKRDLHFFVRDIPIDTPEEWFPLVQNDVQAAAYADIEGDDQELNGEVNYFATEVFDEDGINNVA